MSGYLLFHSFVPCPCHSACQHACLQQSHFLIIRCFCQRIGNQITKPGEESPEQNQGDVSQTAGPPVSAGPGLPHADVVSAGLAARGSSSAHLPFSSPLEDDFWATEVALCPQSLVLNYCLTMCPPTPPCCSEDQILSFLPLR